MNIDSKRANARSTQKKTSKKIVVIAASRKKVVNQGMNLKAGKTPVLQQLNNNKLFLAVETGLKPAAQRKSKLYSDNRQNTSKTEDLYSKEGGAFIKKITQRTNTKASNFSEFPTPIQEKQVKLGHMKEETILKFRSRTVKRKNKGVSKLRSKVSPVQNRNLKYYNIISGIQNNQLKVTPK